MRANLELDGQAVRVPARHKLRFVAFQELAPDDDVFQDFVEGVPDVQVAVGVRGPVMQDIRRQWVACRQPAVHLIVFPPLLDLRLLDVGHASDVEVCDGQIDSRAVHICIMLLVSLSVTTMLAAVRVAYSAWVWGAFQ